MICQEQLRCDGMQSISFGLHVTGCEYTMMSEVRGGWSSVGITHAA